MCSACGMGFDHASLFESMRVNERRRYWGDEDPFKKNLLESIPFTSEELCVPATTQVIEGEVLPGPDASDIYVGEYAACQLEGDCADHGIHVERGVTSEIHGVSFEYEIRWMKKVD